MQNILEVPQPAGGLDKSAAPITDKKGYASRWLFSVRKVDDLLAKGMPHLKCGARRVRISIPEADAWMQEQFSVQRRGKVATA
jgi:hypothetical protein